MSGAAQTARMVMRAPVARAPRPIRVPAPGTARRPAATAVSQPHEPTEREAARVARRVLTMPAPGAAPGPSGSRSAAAGAMPRAAAASASPPASLGVASSAGQPLPERVRQDMEPRLQADFSAVRVHTGDSAARASRRLNAAAFTLGHQVFFGRDRFQPESNAGRELIAHELTHTIQQGAAPQRAAQAPPLAVPRPQRSLQPGALPQITAAPVGPLPPVQRSVADPAAEVRVHQRSEPRVARLGIQDALDYFADKAAWIPGFTMFTFLLGFNPISLRAVSRTAANLLRALIQLLPGGPLITQALDNHGLIDRVAAWAEGQLSALGDIGASVRQSVDDFLDDLSWTDIFDLGGLWDRAKRIVSTPIDRIISFGSSLISGIIDFVKDAILRPIGALAQGTRAWPLLCAVLGYDPVTGDPSPRTPAALLGGFMTLIGQEEVWQNIQRGNAIGQAWGWFQGAMGDLMGFVTALPGTFIAAFRSLELVDIILVPRAFAKIVAVFASFAGRFLSWALGTVIKLLEIIFSVVAPGAMGYLRRAGGALQSIFRNPIGFIGNLVRAAKAGFQKFAGKFLDHLKAGVLIWLTGSLPGIYIPTALSLTEILKFVLSVLGLSWANLRAKLVTAVGEPAVRAMEMGFDLVRTLVTQGPAAAWEQLKESLANLKQMAIDALIDMVVNLVVTRAVPRLVAMFIPGAGFIGAIMAIWGTIQTFMAQLSRIMQVVTGFLNSIAAIASGNIAAAATRVDGILVNLLSLAISFLAGFAGLGRVADRVREVLARIRAPIDQALDGLVRWLIGAARRLGRFVAQAGVPNDPAQRLQLALRASTAVARRLPPGRISAGVIAPLLGAIRTRYGLTSLTPELRQGRWWITAVINPRQSGDTGREDTSSTAFDEAGVWERVAAGLGPEVREVRVSGFSIDAARTALRAAIARSTATPARKASAQGFVDSLVARAAQSTDPHESYRLLQQAGAVVSGLPGVRSIVNIHHVQEVADFPATFVETRTGRLRVPTAVRQQLRQQLARTGDQAAFDELVRLVKQQMLDVDIDRRPRLLAEIDFIVADVTLHQNFHVRTRRGR